MNQLPGSGLNDVVTTEIPVVSMADWRAGGAERRGFAAEVVEACHRTGFLLLVDHGVGEDLIDRYFNSLQLFFALPAETKALMAKSLSRHFRGWEAIGAELTNNQIDYREQIDLSAEHSARPADVTPAYLRLDGPNQWLPAEVLPGFREVVTEYFDAMVALANELMGVIAVGLGLPEDTFTRRFGERPLGFMKLISYPRHPAGRRVSMAITMPASSPCCCSTGLVGSKSRMSWASGLMSRPAVMPLLSISARCCRR